MRVSIIVAVSTNGVIGLDKGLPWHLPGDLKWFKTLTTGHHIVMGRKTFDTVGKPLPNRTNIVVTRDGSWTAPGVVVAHSLEEALKLSASDDEVFIAGGAQIYEAALHRADRMYLTRVHTEVQGDTHFPEFDDVAEWQLVDAEHHEADDKNAYPYSFLTYERIAAGGHAIPEEG